MRCGSVCSGIEAAALAWQPLGWRFAFLSEIEAFPRAVLRHHHPETPLHGDFTTIVAGDYEPVDLLVGGTPCQSFSIAGLRGGLADDRGNLALEFLRLADRLRARWLVWENVAGVLSSSEGRDFGAFLGGLAELGYGFAYRVLDAQFFGLAQRRKRVFVVGHLGDWRRAAAVLFERAGLQGDAAPRRAVWSADPDEAGEAPAVFAFAQNQLGELRIGDVANTLNQNANASGRNTALAAIGETLRRLTPRECERLQGFPDDYTLIRPGVPDGPRYKAIGNSMAVPVMAWIGRRISAVDAIA